MAVLKTNYVDDVLDTSLNEKRKYNMIQNADGTVSFDDVTTYTQNGDSFGAKDVNDTNTAVNELNNNLDYRLETQAQNTYMKYGQSTIGNIDAQSNASVTIDVSEFSNYIILANVQTSGSNNLNLTISKNKIYIFNNNDVAVSAIFISWMVIGTK